MDKIEFDWAISQMEGAGYIKFSKDYKFFFLTELGEARALEIMGWFTAMDKLLLLMYSSQLNGEWADDNDE